MTATVANDRRHATSGRRLPTYRGSVSHAATPSAKSGAGDCIRPLREDDGALLDRLVAGLSSQSRYQRFHSPKRRLTPGERASFTRVDGRDRLGLIALGSDGDPLAVAQAIRLRDDPAAAELGVVVADARQRQGLGTELIRRLAVRAAGVGIERLVASVLAETGLAGGLLRHGWSSAGRDRAVITLVAGARQTAGATRPLGVSSCQAPEGGHVESASRGSSRTSDLRRARR
jgi:GNAT superfamily N-acetyltransferase